MAPTIVGVPGAWHSTEFFEPIARFFEAKGYPFVSRNAPGITEKNPFAITVDNDVQAFRDLLVPLVESGKEVVLLLHSYGGVYGPGAAQGLSRAERREAGKEGGVVGFVFVSAVTPFAGKSCLDMMGTDSKNLPPFVTYDETTGFVHFTGAKEAMYHDIPEDEAAQWIAKIKPQSLKVMDTPLAYSPVTDEWYKGRMGYVYCGSDKLVPLAGQEAYAQMAGIETTALVPEATHAFFLTAAEKIVDAVIDVIGRPG